MLLPNRIHQHIYCFFFWCHCQSAQIWGIPWLTAQIHTDAHTSSSFFLLNTPFEPCKVVPLSWFSIFYKLNPRDWCMQLNPSEPIRKMAKHFPLAVLRRKGKIYTIKQRWSTVVKWDVAGFGNAMGMLGSSLADVLLRLTLRARGVDTLSCLGCICMCICIAILIRLCAKSSLFSVPTLEKEFGYVTNIPMGYSPKRVWCVDIVPSPKNGLFLYRYFQYYW